MTDSSYDTWDNRAYIQFAFQEIENEIYLDPEWWKRNIEIVVIGLLGFLAFCSIIYLFVLKPFPIRGTVIAVGLNFYAFRYFLYVLFFIVRKIVYCLCLHYRLIRTIEGYKNICKSFFLALIIPVPYCFYTSIRWILLWWNFGN
jgi:hypothetical protein